MAAPPSTRPLSVTPKPMYLSFGNWAGSCINAARPAASPSEPTASTSIFSVSTLPSTRTTSTSYVPCASPHAWTKLCPRVWATTTAPPAARIAGTSTDRCIVMFIEHAIPNTLSTNLRRRPIALRNAIE